MDNRKLPQRGSRIQEIDPRTKRKENQTLDRYGIGNVQFENFNETSGREINRPKFSEQLKSTTNTTSPGIVNDGNNPSANIEFNNEPNENSNVELNEQKINVNSKEIPKYAKSSNRKNAKYIRVNLPSLGIPYDGNPAVHIATFNVINLAKIYKATSEEDFSILIDAVNDTVQDVDVRNFTVPDFYFLMYWLRINSYPRSPFTISWTSRYGNENVHKVNQTELEIKVLEMTSEQYENFRNVNIKFPSVRDLELLMVEQLDPEQKFLAGIAQYIDYGDSLKEKIEFLNETEDLSIIEYIKDFEKLAIHGVEESILVTDQNFDAQKAVIHLRDVIKEARNALSSGNTQAMGIGNTREFMNKIIEMEKEADEIEKCIKHNIEYKPKEESIQLQMNALKFFPTD